MLNTLFIIDDTGLVIIEKHWRGITPRDVCDDFWKAVLTYPCYEDVPTVAQFGRFYVVHVYRSGVFFAAILERETDTLLAVEILHRIHNMLKVYMGAVVTAAHIKRSFSTVYQILDEMLYNGVPCTTEPNAMQQMIGVKTIGDSLAGRSHLSSKLATGATSMTPWRKSGVKYNQNEIYFDVVEELDAIVSSSGMTTMQRVHASIQCTSRLSGYPEVTVQLARPEAVKAPSLHPCIRVKTFNATRTLSFVPPDGPFQLMKYRIGKTGSVVELPLYCRPQLLMPSEERPDGTLTIMIGTKPKTSLRATSEKGVSVSNLAVLIPKLDGITVLGHTVDVGTIYDDGNAKAVIWKIGALPGKAVRLKAKVKVSEKYSGVAAPSFSVMLRLTANDANISGVKVKGVKVSRETYSVHKGVRYMVCTGNYTVRT